MSNQTPEQIAERFIAKRKDLGWKRHFALFPVYAEDHKGQTVKVWLQWYYQRTTEHGLLEKLTVEALFDQLLQLAEWPNLRQYENKVIDYLQEEKKC